MTTIPIEVIVQDAEAPVVPGEDGTNNTETNMAVPDTGTISSSGDISSSASSIILPAILLVLAIGSIVAILIHKYHKQKKDKSSKKEKLAVAASSTIAVFAAAVLVSNLVIPATKATTSDIVDGITPAEDKVSITVNRDGGVAEASIESTATITSTSDFGYKVLLSMAEGVETANLYLDGDETSEYYIAPVKVGDEEGAELTDNTWGYALAEDGEYNAVPLTYEAAVATKEIAKVENKELNIYYGVNVDKDLPAGTYSGEIEYDLDDYISTMQEMTSDICDAVSTPNAFKSDGETIEDNVPTVTLKDNRDNKMYTVAKLADGKCWMTRNLDLQKEGLLAGVTLDSTNTDNPAAGFELPDSQNSGTGTWSENLNIAHVYDLGNDGQEYFYCDDYSPMYGGCNTYSEEKIPNIELGNYYNWYTATAATEVESVNGREIAVGSICPAGWRLPVMDYADLMRDYNLENTSFNVLKTFEAPIKIMRAGNYSNGVRSVGGSGNIWSSRQSSRSSAYYSNFNTYETGLYPDSFNGGYNGKSYGFSVRCIAQ